MDYEEMDEMEWSDGGEEPNEVSADTEFDEEISEALEATHEEMEAKQAEADEAAQERAEQRREKKNARRAKEKPPRNYEADRIAASARRQMERLQQENERLQRENDDFAQRLGYRDFAQMQQVNGDISSVQFEDGPRRREQEIAYQEGKQRFEEDLRELNEHFPEVNAWSADDFFALENAQEMVKMVQAGIPLYRAYAAYAVDSITQRRADAAKRAALNAQSKEHLHRLGGTGSAAGGTIPQEVFEQYRLINPEATDAEIFAHWRKQG